MAVIFGMSGTSPLMLAHPWVVSVYGLSWNLVLPSSTGRLSHPLLAGLYQACHGSCVAWFPYLWPGCPEPHIHLFSNTDDRTQSWVLSVQEFKGVIVGCQYHQLNIIDQSPNKGYQPIYEAGTKVTSRNWIVSGLAKDEIKVANRGDQLNIFLYHPASAHMFGSLINLFSYQGHWISNYPGIIDLEITFFSQGNA